MTDRATLKARICEAIDRRAPEIMALGETLLRTPELGFKEVKAAALVTDALRRLGLPYRERLALDADPATGAAHT